MRKSLCLWCFVGLLESERSTITIMNSTSRCSSRCSSRCAIHYSYRAWNFPYLMPIVPQSEIQVKILEKFFKETDAKRGAILAKFSVDFVLQFPGKVATRNFTQIPPHIRTSNSTWLNQNSFTAKLWELVGPTYLYPCNPTVLAEESKPSPAQKVEKESPQESLRAPGRAPERVKNRSCDPPGLLQGSRALRSLPGSVPENRGVSGSVSGVSVSTLRGPLWTLRSLGPEGPQRHSVRHSRRHPGFRGTLPETLRARRAGETPVAALGGRKNKSLWSQQAVVSNLPKAPGDSLRGFGRGVLRDSPGDSFSTF